MIKNFKLWNAGIFVIQLFKVGFTALWSTNQDLYLQLKLVPSNTFSPLQIQRRKLWDEPDKCLYSKLVIPQYFIALTRYIEK